MASIRKTHTSRIGHPGVHPTPPKVSVLDRKGGSARGSVLPAGTMTRPSTRTRLGSFRRIRVRRGTLGGTRSDLRIEKERRTGRRTPRPHQDYRDAACGRSAILGDRRSPPQVRPRLPAPWRADSHRPPRVKPTTVGWNRPDNISASRCRNPLAHPFPQLGKCVGTRDLVQVFLSAEGELDANRPRGDLTIPLRSADPRTPSPAYDKVGRSRRRRGPLVPTCAVLARWAGVFA